MPIILRLSIFATILSLLWVYQPPILKQPDPAVELKTPGAEQTRTQTLEGAVYQMNDKGVIWDIVAQKATLTPEGIVFQSPKASTQDGRLLKALEAYWSFSESKIFFKGDIVILDTAQNMAINATQACYDINAKELLFDEPLQGEYSGSL